MTRQYAEADAIPNDWRTRQPGRAIWCIIGVPRFLLLAIFYSILYIPSALRPSRKWNYTQAMRTKLIKTAFGIITEIGFTQSLSLDAGEAGDKWVTINPAAADLYRGPFASNGSVKPEVIGGTWYPDVPPPPHSGSEDDDNLVVLSFHSGSFLWLTGRPDDSAFTADLLNKALGPGTRSFWPQYRLACDRQNPTKYPGPMQDAITAYVYLVKELGISPRRIVFAGDSSGATIAMALVRYLASVNNLPPSPSPSLQNTDIEAEAGAHNSDNIFTANLPPPRACLLFSPSVEYSLEGDSCTAPQSRNGRTDYVDGPLMAWGAAAFAPAEIVRLDDPYLSPALHPFATPVPIFAQAGGAEVLCDSTRGFAEAFRAIPGNIVEFMEVPDAPHDIYAVGIVIGWLEKQKEVVNAAAGFARRQ